MFESYRKKRMRHFVLVCLLAIALIQGALIKPIFLSVASNSAFRDTPIPLLIDFLYSLLELIFYWVSFAALLYAYTRFSSKFAWGIVGIYAVATVIRYGAELLFGYLLMGFSDADQLLLDAFSATLDIFLMLLLIGVAFLVILFALRKQIALSNQERSEIFTPYFSVSRMFDLKNPILKALFLLAVLPCLMRVFSHISTDLYLGAPTATVDLIWMVVTYLSDILFVFVGYYVMLLLINQIRIKELHSQMLYDANSNAESKNEK